MFLLWLVYVVANAFYLVWRKSVSHSVNEICWIGQCSLRLFLYISSSITIKNIFLDMSYLEFPTNVLPNFFETSLILITSAYDTHPGVSKSDIFNVVHNFIIFFIIQFLFTHVPIHNQYINIKKASTVSKKESPNHTKYSCLT